MATRLMQASAAVTLALYLVLMGCLAVGEGQPTVLLVLLGLSGLGLLAFWKAHRLAVGVILIPALVSLVLGVAWLATALWLAVVGVLVLTTRAWISHNVPIICVMAGAVLAVVFDTPVGIAGVGLLYAAYLTWALARLPPDFLAQQA